ncbi:MAG: hypothetical protein N2258_09005 [Brevinematales bacterium]|nr:hypothetical protein [Brevinematales bacterium]
MSVVFSIFLFFVYKLFIIDFVVLFQRLFPLRIDFPVIAFYTLISLFQFFFFLFNLIKLTRKDSDSTILIEYFSLLIILIEISSLLLSGYFLFKSENELNRLFSLFVSTFVIHPIYFFLNNMITNNFVTQDLKTLKLRFLSPLFFYFISFLVPFIFIFNKIFIEKKFIFFDIVIFSVIILANILTIFFNYLIENYNIKILLTIGKIKDLKTLYLKNAIDRLKQKEKNELNFIDSTYLSQTIKGAFIKKGLSFINEDYEVTIVALKFNISIENYHEKNILENFCKTVGLFAKEYDAFPLFCIDQVFLIFGFPINYEHKNYNAIELVERIIKDTGNIVNSEFEGKIFLYAAICEGLVSPYLLNLRGGNYKDIYLRGNGINFAQKLSAIAEANKIPLIVSKELYEQMKSRILVEKALKIKDKEGELLVYQVRL